MANDLPPRARAFVDKAGWSGSDVRALPADASSRRYFRLVRGEERAMLMDAPPPDENPGAFLDAAHYLLDKGFRAPAILAEAREDGLILLEDFGDTPMRSHVEAAPGNEEATYAAAVDTLARLHAAPGGPFDPYDFNAYLREVKLLPEWFCRSHGVRVDDDGYEEAWREVLAPLLDRQGGGVTVLRDYHAENIMVLDDGDLGLIDFQDALLGHRAYDLVSLLQDARRDVSPALETAMLDRYRRATGADDDFDADYARLGAQRNAKIVGIFVRLAERDGKDRYLKLIPRVWNLLERDLAHPALAPVARWFDANIDGDLRTRVSDIGA